MSSIYLLNLLQESLPTAVVYIVSLVAAISVHECAHAWTAYRLGDDTPHLQGRVTLNPAAHLDPLGSIVFLVFGMGWGRPVVYNPMRLSRKVDELLIALAGPASNLVFALFLNILAYAVAGPAPFYSEILRQAAAINVILAAFNMVPIPPLDGSSIVAYFWPPYRSLIGGQIGLIILLAIVFVPVGPHGGIIGTIIPPVINLFDLVTHLFGLI